MISNLKELFKELKSLKRTLVDMKSNRLSPRAIAISDDKKFFSDLNSNNETDFICPDCSGELSYHYTTYHVYYDYNKKQLYTIAVCPKCRREHRYYIKIQKQI